MEINYLETTSNERIWKGEKAGGCQGVHGCVDMRSRCEICRHRRKNRLKVPVCTDVNVRYIHGLTQTEKKNRYFTKKTQLIISRTLNFCSRKGQWRWEHFTPLRPDVTFNSFMLI